MVACFFVKKRSAAGPKKQLQQCDKLALLSSKVISVGDDEKPIGNTPSQNVITVKEKLTNF